MISAKSTQESLTTDLDPIFQPELKKIEFKNCSWCNYAGAAHEGGFILSEGSIFDGFFCNKECFELWRTWKIALMNFQKSIKEKKDGVIENGE